MLTNENEMKKLGVPEEISSAVADKANWLHETFYEHSKKNGGVPNGVIVSPNYGFNEFSLMSGLCPVSDTPTSYERLIRLPFLNGYIEINFEAIQRAVSNQTVVLYRYFDKDIKIDREGLINWFIWATDSLENERVEAAGIADILNRRNYHNFYSLKPAST